MKENNYHHPFERIIVQPKEGGHFRFLRDKPINWKALVSHETGKDL